MAPTATASRPAKRSGSSASRRARWPRSASKPRNAANGASASTATATTAIARAPRAARAERNADGGYPGTCRNGPKSRGATATRFRVDDGTVCFEDRAQGECRFELRERGDVIIRRRDGAFAYQLAVVVDDALQGVTDVVRGADLLDSTPWQIALQGALRLPTPHYLHLPLVTEPGGAKLAKARRSVALDPRASGRSLHEALRLLNQDPPH